MQPTPLRLREVCPCNLLMAEAMTIFCFSLLFFCSHALVSAGSSNATTEELALLAFKSMLSSPSKSLVASWNTSSHYCSWTGVVCSRRQPERVVSLLMGSFNLSGRLSPFLGNLSFLRKLDLHGNQFVGQIPPELGQLSRLQMLNLSTNTLHGSIPEAMGGCTNLTTLDLSNNLLQGEIPTGIGALKNLVSLSLRINGLSGDIPHSLTNLSSIKHLSLRNNRLSGEIPSDLGNLTNLHFLELDDNMLSGAIPSSLGLLSQLSELILGYNNLSGLIPPSVWNISSLTRFSVSQNMLSGTIPPNAFSTLPHLQVIAMDNNQFHGNIPTSIGNASDFWLVQLGATLLSGIVPPEIGRLTKLKILILSIAFFEAKEPKDWEFLTTLTNCSQLQDIGLSYCRLAGVLPDSISNLSTSLTSLALEHNSISGSLPRDIALVILSLLYILLTWRKRTKTRTPSTTLAQGHPLISYFRLVKATDGFSPTNLLGSGSFGSVYKGELDGQDAESKDLVVVKVLKLQNPRALKSFIAECEALRNMRHRNLVKIITACASIDARGDDFKAIVYDFMPNGSLDGWIHADANEQTRERSLGLSERVTILLDVAYALNYLHCDGPTPVIHCDLKPSNVLLDADMVAHVGDFGLAKIIVDGGSVVQQSASSMGFRGTISYAAPEYGAGNVVSTNGDIYSYGILVLEMVTARRPTDTTFREGLSLREYVELALVHNGTMDIIDMRLSLSLKNDELQGAGEGDSPHKRKTDCLIALLRLGLSCSEELPSSRMPTGDIIKELLRIKGSLM